MDLNAPSEDGCISPPLRADGAHTRHNHITSLIIHIELVKYFRGVVGVLVELYFESKRRNNSLLCIRVIISSEAGARKGYEGEHYPALSGL